MSENTTTKVILKDGKLFQHTPEGLVALPDPEPLLPMSDEEIHARALTDPDNPPRDVDTRKWKPVPRVRTLRRVLGLTQEEFAAKYHIPVGTLRDWEQGRKEPDATARAYLHVIAAEHAAVERAFSVPAR